MAEDFWRAALRREARSSDDNSDSASESGEADSVESGDDE